jgi:Glycosyltransferase family 87
MSSRHLPRGRRLSGRSMDGHAAPRRAAINHALFGVLPILLTADVMYYCFHHGHIDAIDFHHEFWPAAQFVLHGVSPYHRGWMHISGGVAFPYPAFTAIAFVPLALMNPALADWVFTFIIVGAVLLTLRVLRVRDWRLYGLVLLLSPVVNGWQTANLTLLLGLGIALLWRRRDHPIVAGALVAVMVSLKPFVWPLGLWLLATRRYRALVYGVVWGVALNAVAWALVGLNQLHVYSQLVSTVNDVMDRRGYSVMALAMHFGVGRTGAYGLGVAVAAGAGVACVIAGRRGHDRAALALGVAACLLVTPVLWTHYFALLIVPLALYRPRLDRVWLLLLVLWVCPAIEPAPWQIITGLVTSAVVIGLILLGQPRYAADQHAVRPRAELAAAGSS